MRSIWTLSTSAGLAVVLAGAGLAADHLDAPALNRRPSADITDVYAFVSPMNPGNVVIVANFAPLAEPDAAFARRGTQIHFDLDGNAIADLSFAFKFSGVKRNGTQKIKGNLSGSPDTSLNRRLIKGRTTPAGDSPNVIDARADITAFAGLRDDPFFADMRALDRPFVCPPGIDTYAGANVLSIVLELPPGVFAPGARQVPPFGVWVETKRDSLGSPLTNRLLIPPNKLVPTGNATRHDRYNETAQHFLEDVFFGDVLRTAGVLNDPQTANRLAHDTFPDVLFLDPRRHSGFPNGRALADDVVDDLINHITGGVESKDCVNRNDLLFNQVFPYLAEPHPG